MSLNLSAINWKEQIFPKRDKLGDDLTSIDYLKTVAITLMIIDHVGWLLFPEIEWFRVLGRLCVPIWFFLIGFASARDIPTRWWVAGIVLMLSSMLVGLNPLAMPILFTMAFTRLLIDRFWGFSWRKPIYFWWTILLLIFCAWATDLLFEYGTMGFLLALGGYAMRHRKRVARRLGAGVPDKILMVAVFSFGLLQAMKFGFTPLAAMALFAGLVGVYFVLHDFSVKTFAGTAQGVHAPLIRFCGRYTLEIYVIHLLILKGVYGLGVVAEKIIG